MNFLKSKISAMLMLFGLVTATISQEVWTLSNPLPANDILWTGVTYGNGKFVCVGAAGSIITSGDGMSWTKKLPGTAVSFNLNDIIWAENQFIAVGYTGIFASQDANTWTKQTTDTTWHFTGVAWGGGRYVAVGYAVNNSAPLAAISLNGASWAGQIGNTTDQFRSVTWANNQFLALDNYAQIMISTDGLNWIYSGTFPTSADTSTYVEKISWCNNQFIAVGGSIRACHAICTDEFYANIFTSQNGTTWSKWRSPQSSKSLQGLFGITYGDNNYVAVGGFGSSAIYSSTDALIWTLRVPGTTLRSVAWGNHAFVAVGGGDSILVSQSSTPTTRFDLFHPLQGAIITNKHITYQIQSGAIVKIRILTLQGRLVNKLPDCRQGRGSYSLAIPYGLTPGSYIISLDIGNLKSEKIVTIAR